MKAMFQDSPGEAYTREAQDFSNQLQDAIQPIIQEWQDQGYSVRDIQNLAMGVVIDVCLSAVIAARTNNASEGG